MIQKQSFLTVSDNSGARKILCIRIVPGTKKIGTAGDLLVATVKKALPSESFNLNDSQKNNLQNSKIIVKKSNIVLAVIIRIKNFLNRDNGFFVSFDTNATILVKSDKTPRGSRIFGPVSKELRKKNLLKIISIATEII